MNTHECVAMALISVRFTLLPMATTQIIMPETIRELVMLNTKINKI